MDFRKDTCDDHPVARPATGETPVSNFRIPRNVRDAAMAKARAEGRTLTDVIVAYLRRYASTPPRPKSEPPEG
jgi:hypothetical protein